MLVTALLKALSTLLDVLLLTGFAYAVFGIAGVNLFAGVLDNRCSVPVFGDLPSAPPLGSTPLVLANVSYRVPNEDGQMCSGYLASDVSWLLEPGDTAAAGGPNISLQGGHLGGGYNCPIVPDADGGAPHGYVCAFWSTAPSSTSFNNGYT